MEHNETSTQTMEQVNENPMAGKTETQIIRAVVAEVLAKSDCECNKQGSTVYQQGVGMVTTYSYVDEYGRDWGYDSTCGGKVQPKEDSNPLQ